MHGLRLLTFLLLIMFACMIGSSACTRDNQIQEPILPELLFANDLQIAIDQVLLAYPDHRLGISAAVIVPGCQTWTGTSGYSHQNVPISGDMLFVAGSVQKNFEAALVFELAEEGILSLDDPISKYLPPYPNVDQEITIRQLMNHTSGIFNVFEHPDFPWTRMDVDYSREWEEVEVFANFVLEPYGPPGYAQHYSSTNYLLLTSIIEEATGSTVPLAMSQYFFVPMELDHTYISMGEPPPEEFSVAHPWVDRDNDGNLEDLIGIPHTWIASLSHPVMFSTSKDLVTWINALYYEQTVLSPASLSEMLTYPNDALPDPEGGKYGLGVVDYSDIIGKHTYGHLGSSLGYSAAALFLPEYNISIAWLINTGESPQSLGPYMMGDLWSAIYGVIKKNENDFLDK